MQLHNLHTSSSDPPMNPSITSILSGKYPAKYHLQRVLSRLRSLNNNDDDTDSSTLETSLLFLESAQSRNHEDSDQETEFRQRRYFYYLTGCELPDSVFVYDVKRDEGTLFIPPVVDAEVIWSGLPMLPEEALEKYDVDKVLTTCDLEHYLQAASSAAIAAIPHQPSHPSLTTTINTTTKSTIHPTLSLTLKLAIQDCRVIKSPYEIALIRKANHISGLAHRAVFRTARHARNERDLHATFLARCIAAGAPTQAYSPIVATGTDASTLHYVKNNKPITPATLNLLLDAGAEYNCYAADITRTIPLSGKFSKESLEIYTLVLSMQKQCLSRLRAGTVWDTLQTLAHEIAVAGLLSLGILRGDPKEILAARTSVAFFPHGLGHYLGMDTHDTGGLANYDDPDPLFRYLRVRGAVPAGSVITVEPGVYFCKFMIEPFLGEEKHARFIDRAVLERYWEVGGVRIEDDVLVTEEGYECLTDVPREVGEVEALMAEG